MTVEVRIERDGAVLETLTLGPGEHGIGRAPDNAVVLADGAVSSHHALLRVKETEAELLDLGSLNGTFVDGEKVARTTFNRAETADICGFRLVFSAKAAPRKRFALPSGRGLGTRPAILLTTAALAMCAYLAAWLPAQQAWNAFARTEALQRGALLTRSLAEANVVPLQAKLLDQLRTVSVAAEDGVRQAIVTDPYGKVLAPAQDMGRILDDPQVNKAAKARGLSLWTTTDGDTALACPIREGDALLGLALVFFKPGHALSGPSRMDGVLFGLFVAALAWGVAAWGLARLTLGPVRRMAEDIGVALKSGTSELPVVPASREIAELKRAVERALLLVPTGASDRNAPPQTPEVPGVTAGPESDATRGGQLQPQESHATDDAAWCLLNLANYQLTAWSPAFETHLASRDMVAPVHLLSALSDPAMLAALAGVVDDPAGEAARQVENRPFTARKEPGPHPGTVRVRVTETA